MTRSSTGSRAALGQVSLVVAGIVLLGCTAPPTYYVAPGHEGAPGVARVLLCPPNVAVALPAEISGDAEPVQRELVAYLQEHGLETEELRLGEGRYRWREAAKDAKSEGTPDATERFFAQGLAQEVEFQALIMPSLVLHSVRVFDSSGTWDGVRREVPMKNAPRLGVGGADDTLSKGVHYGALNGDVMATSLHLIVLSPEGQRVFEGRGGLDYIQEMDMSAAQNLRWDLRMKKGAIDDPEVLREGVRIALGPYLPPRSGR